MRAFLIVILGIGSVSACSDKKEQLKENPGSDLQSTDRSPAPATAVDREDQKDDPDDYANTATSPLPEVPGVVPLTVELAAAARNPKAKASNVAGVKALRSEDYKTAIEHFKESLVLDPGSLLPRYNLACALVRSGESGQGLSLLRQFRDVQCEGCRDRLVRARLDKDWEGLWSDRVFKSIVAPLVQGNEVGVAYYDWRLPETLKRASFTLRPRLVLDRLPGEATIPAFTLVLRTSKKEISRAPFDLTKRKAAQIVGEIKVPGIGRYAVDLVAGDRVYESTFFEVKAALCLGGVQRFELVGDSLEFLVSGGREYDYVDDMEHEIGDEEGDESATLSWSFPLPGDDNYEYLEIGRRNGSVEFEDIYDVQGTDFTHVESQDGSNPSLLTNGGLCTVGRTPIQLEVPLEPGNWVYGLYSQRGVSFEIRYSLRRGAYLSDVVPSLRTLAKAPAWTKKHFEEASDETLRPPQWDGKGQPMSTRLVRAATRSAELYAAVLAYEKKGGPDEAKSLLALAAKHGGPWTKKELPKTMEWPKSFYETDYAKPAEGKCNATHCWGYPAISPDGKFVATYEPEEIVFWDEEDECGRPEGNFLRIHETATGKEVPSKDLSDYVKMDCTSDGRPLEAGFSAVFEEDEDYTRMLSIKNSKGKTINKVESSASSFDYCTSPGKRVVVTQENESIGHCHETGTTYFEMMPY